MATRTRSWNSNRTREARHPLLAEREALECKIGRERLRRRAKRHARKEQEKPWEGLRTAGGVGYEFFGSRD